MVEYYPLKIKRGKARCSLLLLLFNIVLEILTNKKKLKQSNGELK